MAVLPLKSGSSMSLTGQMRAYDITAVPARPLRAAWTPASTILPSVIIGMRRDEVRLLCEVVTCGLGVYDRKEMRRTTRKSTTVTYKVNKGTE